MARHLRGVAISSPATSSWSTHNDENSCAVSEITPCPSAGASLIHNSIPGLWQASPWTNWDTYKTHLQWQERQYEMTGPHSMHAGWALTPNPETWVKVSVWPVRSPLGETGRTICRWAGIADRRNSKSWWSYSLRNVSWLLAPGSSWHDNNEQSHSVADNAPNSCPVGGHPYVVHRLPLTICAFFLHNTYHL